MDLIVTEIRELGRNLRYACLKKPNLLQFPFFPPNRTMPCKTDIARRFTRALPAYGQHAAAQTAVAQRLLALVQSHLSEPPAHVLEIGCGSGIYTRLLQRHIPAKTWHINDLCESCRQHVQADRFLGGDIETLPLPQQYNLITSASAFQWLADPAALLVKLNACLKTGGLLAFNTYTPDNLHQIKALTGAGLHYPDQTYWQTALDQAGFRLLHIESERITLHFDSPQAVLHHLKNTGVTATGPYRWTKARLAAFCRQYRERYAAHNTVPLTYTPLYIVAHKT